MKQHKRNKEGMGKRKRKMKHAVAAAAQGRATKQTPEEWGRTRRGKHDGDDGMHTAREGERETKKKEKA